MIWDILIGLYEVKVDKEKSIYFHDCLGSNGDLNLIPFADQL